MHIYQVKVKILFEIMVYTTIDIHIYIHTPNKFSVDLEPNCGPVYYQVYFLK